MMVVLFAGGIVIVDAPPPPVPVYVTEIERYAPVLLRSTQYAFASVANVEVGRVNVANALFVMLKYVP